MKSGVPTLLVPLPNRIKAEFLNYAKGHRDELSPAQHDVLLRYAANDEILNVMVNSFFDEWEANDRRGRLEAFAQNAIAELLKIY